MIVRKMTATFGRLDHAVLEPGAGLTVITAPNEGGKSTWAGFLRAMLYGINTRERDREGRLAEKNRYAPWSGAPMEGELKLVWRGKEITLRRFGRRGSAFGGFEAVYTATGDPVPGLTADTVGELLVGAGREMYERSAFVSQGGAAVTGSAELEKRIAALATSGEEDVSYGETERVLKDWRNRRMANKANGLLPQLDEELRQTRAAIDEVKRVRRDWEAAGGRLKELEREKQTLERELETYRQLAVQELNLRYVQARRDWQVACAAVPGERPHPLFGTMTGEEAWAFAQSRVEEGRQAKERARRYREERVLREQERDRTRKTAGLSGLLTIVGGLMTVLLFLVRLWGVGVFMAAAAVAGLVFWFRCRRQAAEAARALDNLTPVDDPPETGDLLEQAAAYRAELARGEQARAAVRLARQRMDDLAAQGGRGDVVLTPVQPPDRPEKDVRLRLADVTVELSRVRRNLDMARGRMDTLGDIDELYAKLDSLSARREERQREYDALTMAMDALSAANDTLRQRFSPQLNRRASELFARLTGGEYAALELSRSFDASVVPAGQVLPRSALALSRGTVEQLYLAVRLAVCQLTLDGEDPPPLVLDDALADFDDRRMELALELLRELGQERQILLFTCHSREADWARRVGVPTISLQSEGK